MPNYAKKFQVEQEEPIVLHCPNCNQLMLHYEFVWLADFGDNRPMTEIGHYHLCEGCNLAVDGDRIPF